MFEGTGATFGILWVLYYTAWFAINCCAAIWIYKDAENLPTLFINSKPAWWAFAALVMGGIWVVLVYWAIHHSTFSNRESSNEI